MERKAFSGIMLIMLLMSMLTLAFNVQPVSSEVGTFNISVSDYPDPFNLLYEHSTITITNEGTIQCTEVTLSIKDIDRDWRWENVTPSTSVQAVWDGRDGAENIVGAGTYNYKAIGTYEGWSDAETGTITVVSGNTWYVPDDYSTIQEAINAASPGDTIYVRAGTYYECLIINKALTLVGEDRSTTVIDGNRTGTVVTITANYVTVSGFTIQGSKGGYIGIFLDASRYSSIINDNIANNYNGIYLRDSSNNNIFGNNITAQNTGGITLYTSSNNYISGNNIVNNKVGIYLIKSSSNNSISGNNMTANCAGIWFWGTSNNTIFHNNFVNNTHEAGNPGTTIYDRSFDQWDDGYPSGGNYWSDYTSVDLYSGPYQNETGSDGIWDHPYVIDADNQDRYPLMNPWRARVESPWPMFQHDAQHTGRSPFIGPSKNPQAQILLGNKTIEDIFGYPVIGSDGTLYLGARINYKSGLYAFTPDGTQKWFYETPSVGLKPPALLESAKTVYTFSNHEIYAVNMENGSLKWKRSFVYIYDNLAVGDDGILYFTALRHLPDDSYRTYLIGLDENGEEVLAYDIGEMVWTKPSCPTIDKEGTIYLGYNDTLFSINPNGTEKWRRTFEANIRYHRQGSWNWPKVTTPSIADDGTIYVVVIRESDWRTGTDQGYRNHLHAINPENPMEDKWTYGLRSNWPQNPVIGFDGNVYVTNWYYVVGSGGQSQLVVFTPQGSLKASQHFIGYGHPSLLLIDAENTVYALRMSVYGTASLHIFDSEGNQTVVNLPFQEGHRQPFLSLGSDGTLYIGGHKNLYAVKSTVVPPPVPTQPPQPINISPADGATDVSLTPQLLSSPPLQDVDKELIPWEEIDGLWVTRVDSQWQITTTLGDYSDPVWDSTLTDGLIDRRFFPDLPDAWANWVPSGVLDYETTYYWRVSHRDFRGVWSSWSEETSFTTRRYVPPEAAFDYFPERPKSGDKVKLDASASRPGETWSISYYRWDLDGDGDFDGLTTSPVIYYRWDKSGTYNVTLEVVNWVGDSDTTSKEIIVEQNSCWERTVVAWWKRIFGPEGPTEEDLQRFEIIKRELRLEEFEEFYDSDTPIWVRDMQILTALKEKMAPEEGEITYEQYILQILHDIELVDLYVNYPWGAQPPINEYFTSMAEVSKWAELGLLLGGVALEGLISAAGGSGVGIGVILMIPDVVEAGISLKLLYKTLYERERWLFFNDIYDQNLLHLNKAQREHLQALKDEYAEPLRTRGEEFKNEVREELRKILHYVLEKYKLWPVQAYQIKSPVELRVYDSQGNVAGLVNGNVNEEIAGSVYVDGTVLLYPATGSYYLVVVGTEQGTYGVTVISVRERVVLNFTATDIPTSANAIHRYTIDWDVLSLGGKGVTVQVDSDGDGVFEHTFTSDSELSHNEYVAAINAINTWITDSDFNEIETFRVVFTPYGNTELYKLTATNPGQFYFNILVNNTWSEPLNMTIVYSIDANFILKGARSIHVYADLERTIDITANCTFSDNTISVYNVAPNAIIYVTIHLDYALKDTTWTKEEVEAWYSEHGFSATVHSVTSKVVITDPELQIPPMPLSLIFFMGVLPAIVLCLGIFIALLKYALLPTKKRALELCKIDENCRKLTGYGGLFCVYWYLLGFPCLVNMLSLTRSISA